MEKNPKVTKNKQFQIIINHNKPKLNKYNAEVKIETSLQFSKESLEIRKLFEKLSFFSG